MRNEILQLKDLGRMPNESINDTESIDELVNTYDALLEQIQLPISFDEAMVLVQIFPVFITIEQPKLIRNIRV